jgi:dTDP-4-amino-4,6-dideoxygalactose transaminase
MKPSLPSYSSLLDSLLKIDESRVYSNYGQTSWRLRQKYGEYLKVNPEKIIPLANATLALQGCLELSKQAAWLLPDYTFAATFHAAISASKQITILDVYEGDFQIKIPESIDRSRFGILPVMPFGAPVELEKYFGFNGVVFDAAASLGSPPPDFSLMPKDSYVVYSLHATKVLGAGEGAIVVCENEDQAAELRAWSNFGFQGSRMSSIKGTNAKMSEFACAVALASISHIDIEKTEWVEALNHIRSANMPERFKTIVNSYPGFGPYWIIQTEDFQEKNDLELFLSKHEIETRSWWPSRISDMVAFGSLRRFEDTVTARRLANTHLGLPIWRGIGIENVNYIAKCLSQFDKSRRFNR